MAAKTEEIMDFAPNVLLLSATIADMVTTLFGLGVGCTETNPVVANYGWGAVFMMKLIGTLFVVGVLRNRKDRLGGLAFLPGLIVTLVVMWNLLNVTAQLI
jgi:hypothetical protein